MLRNFAVRDSIAADLLCEIVFGIEEENLLSFSIGSCATASPDGIFSCC